MKKNGRILSNCDFVWFFDKGLHTTNMSYRLSVVNTFIVQLLFVRYSQKSLKVSLCHIEKYVLFKQIYLIIFVNLLNKHEIIETNRMRERKK